MKFFERQQIRRQPKAQIALPIFLALVLGLGLAQKAPAATPTPLAGETFVKLIPIACTAPNTPPGCLNSWTTTGAATQASTDIFSFDRSTHTMYFADRVNRGVSVINTNTNTYLGTILVPSCNVATAVPGSCPSGVLVAPDLRKLVVTDRNISVGGVTTDLNHVFIYDLNSLATPPVQLTIGPPQWGAAFDTDELEYDPINHRAYVANTKGPFFLTVVDLMRNTIVDQIPLPSNPEQPRFNPIDGMIYQTIPDDGTIATGGPNDSVLRINPTKSGAAAIVGKLAPPAGCAVRGIDIDPLTNTAIVGCALSAAQFQLDLSSGAVLNTFPGVTGTDTLYFNPNLRRWYTASSNNTNSGVLCPSTADTPPVFPVVGVFAAHRPPNNVATIVGADCSGRNGHGIGVDPIHNNVYVGARQFPADPNSTATNSPGVLVLHDPAALAQGEVEEADAPMRPFGNFRTRGTVHFAGHNARAKLNHVPSGSNILLNVTTTVGNELVTCTRDAKPTDHISCEGTLLGEPLIGGVTLLGVGGTPIASGRIVLGEASGSGD
jgi:hypothetical protein